MLRSVNVPDVRSKEATMDSFVIKLISFVTKQAGSPHRLAAVALGCGWLTFRQAQMIVVWPRLDLCAIPYWPPQSPGSPIL